MADFFFQCESTGWFASGKEGGILPSTEMDVKVRFLLSSSTANCAMRWIRLGRAPDLWSSYYLLDFRFEFGNLSYEIGNIEWTDYTRFAPVLSMLLR